MLHSYVTLYTHPTPNQIVNKMKITIERKYKKAGYTIGNLYLNDTKPLCNTLEPTDRGLHFDYTKPDRTTEFRRVALKATAEKGAHNYGTTAIPTGCYEVKMSPSSKFKALRPFLFGVPGFAGIMIHEGNTAKDTKGCILVGENTKPGKVLNSRKYINVICDAIQEAERKNEKVIITIK